MDLFFFIIHYTYWLLSLNSFFVGTAAIDTLELGLRDLISICDHVKETFVSECERVDAEQGLD